jgi:hypothetical protein
MRRLLIAVPLACSCAFAEAQTLSGNTALRLTPPLDSGVMAPSLDRFQNQPQRRDSLWNGVLAGAALGALFGAAGSLAVTDCSECAGFNVPLTFGVIGAGVGAGLGAGIDALRVRGGASPQRQPHLQLSPLVGGNRRGLMAWLRF